MVGVLGEGMDVGSELSREPVLESFGGHYISEKTLWSILITERPGFGCQFCGILSPSLLLCKMELIIYFVRFLSRLCYEKHLANSKSSINGSY